LSNPSFGYPKSNLYLGILRLNENRNIMRSLLVAILGIAILTFSSCSTQTTEVATTPEAKPAPVIKVDQNATTCKTLADLPPSIRSNTEDAFTLYRDNIRFKKYGEARDLWKQAYYTAPGANGKATYHFDDGIKIYDYLFKNETDENKKIGLVDTILSIYDKKGECFGDDGTMMARKAFNSYYSYSQYTNSDETFAIFKEVVNRKGMKTDYFVVNPFSKLLYDRVLEDKIDKAEASALALKVFDIIDHGRANCEGQFCEAWNVINEYAPPLLSGLEGMRGFFPCDYFMKNYYPQYEEDPTDCDNITEVYLKMVWAGCDPSDAKFVALKEAKEKECYVAPPPPGPLRLAAEALENGDFREAIGKYEEFDAHIKNFPSARQYARQAAEYRANWGEPYMLIGKLYASSGPLCGPGTGWDSQVVTWPAIDKFEYAKKIDPNVAEEANKWIRRYSQYMPKKEDIFFRQMKAGSSYKVPCWIQETTRIRTSD